MTKLTKKEVGIVGWSERRRRGKRIAREEEKG